MCFDLSYIGLQHPILIMQDSWSLPSHPSSSVKCLALQHRCLIDAQGQLDRPAREGALRLLFFSVVTTTTTTPAPPQGASVTDSTYPCPPRVGLPSLF